MYYRVNLVPILDVAEGPITKLDALLAKRDALQAELDANTSIIAGLGKTPFGQSCSACGEVLATERDFAGHFTVARMDILNDHLNLGDCPKSAHR